MTEVVSTKKSPQKIRTFAQDVAALKKGDAKKVPETPVKKQKKAAIKKAAPKARQKKVHVPEKPADAGVVVEKKDGSLLTNKDDVFDVSGAFNNQTETGTIITDKKRRKLSLGEMAFGAAKEWVAEAKEVIEDLEPERSKPKPKISTTESRKKIIEKASKDTTPTPVDDHRVVVEKMRTLKHDAEVVTGKPFLIKEAPKKAPGQWSHVIQDDEQKTDSVVEVPKEKEKEKTETKETVILEAPAKEERPAIHQSVAQPPVLASGVVAPSIDTHSEDALTHLEKTSATPPKPAPAQATPLHTSAPTVQKVHAENIPTKEDLREVITKTEAAPTEIPLAEGVVAPRLHEKKTPAPKKKSAVPRKSFWSFLNNNVSHEADTPEPVEANDAQPSKWQFFNVAVEEKQPMESVSYTETSPEAESAIEEQEVALPEAAPTEAEIPQEEPEEITAPPKAIHDPQDVPTPVSPAPPARPRLTPNPVEHPPLEIPPFDTNTPTPPKVSLPVIEPLHSDPPQTAESKKPQGLAKAVGETPSAPQKQTKRVNPARQRAVLVVVLILCAVAGAGMGAYLIQFKGASSTLPIVQNIPGAVFHADEKVAVNYSPNRETLLGTLTEQVGIAPLGVTHLYPTVSTESGTEVVTTDTLFNTLQLRASASFVRSLSEHSMLGSVTTLERNEPFIFLTSNNFDMAFAGMIAWEPFMSSDLAPLFGAPVSRSFDINTRTQDRTTEAHFTDAFVRNKSVRILYDELGSERIVYTLIDHNTIVITQTTQALSALLDRR